MNKLYVKAEKYNTIWWRKKYDPYFKYEKHHIYLRNGVFRCCPILWTLAKHGHQDDWKWVEDLRDAFLPLKQKVLRNVIFKGYPCYEKIKWECDYCYFFKDKK
jgi:hypothetical protein